MEKLDPLQTFVEVVRAGSFTGAAQTLGMPRSTVSLHIKTLENALGARLLKRSTRALSLTEEGCLLFERAKQGLQLLTGAMDMVRNRPDDLSGLIRLTAPTDFPGGMLARAMVEFKRQHPRIRFEIMLTNAALDMIDDNIDIAMRIGARGDINRVERQLAPIHWQFCASPDWAGQNDAPSGIADIKDFISPGSDLRAFLERFVLSGKKLPHGAIMADNQLMIRDLVLAGAGIALLPDGLCRDLIEAGRLRPLLENVVTASPPLNLTFPSRADITPRVRAFADKLTGLFSDKCQHKGPGLPAA
ncbi:MAG: LysR family transcriptional regulator [Tsuneonella suprasediminis]